MTGRRSNPAATAPLGVSWSIRDSAVSICWGAESAIVVTAAAGAGAAKAAAVTAASRRRSMHEIQHFEGRCVLLFALSGAGCGAQRAAVAQQLAICFLRSHGQTSLRARSYEARCMPPMLSIVRCAIFPIG